MFRRPRQQPQPVSKITELLIAGHLPVRGGLWLTPYADAVAREFGSTALLRLDGEEPSLQLLRAPIDLASWPQDRSLQQTINELGSAVDYWVVRPAASSRPADLIQSGADRITILSSADEAAMVAAYQLVKDLVHAAQQLGRTLPCVGLAIVGSDPKNAAAVVERFNRTTGSFLDVEISLARCLPRMDAGVKSTRFMSFSGLSSLTEVMQNIEQAKSASPASSVQNGAVAGQIYADRIESQVMHAQDILKSPPAARIAPVTEPNVSQFGSKPYAPPSPAFTSMTDAHRERIEPAPVSSQAAAPFANASSATVKLAPKPAITWEPKRPSAAVEPDDHGLPIPLANHVAGLTPLPIRSPGHERVELAIDGAGRLHLLGREQSLREMRCVEGWTKAHRELIAMACPQHKIDHAAKIICHVFSAQPASLGDLHGSDLRLHVLAPVVVNGQTGWYAAPLNTTA